MDDIAKRREARRRKILENSQNRLSKITGIEQKSTQPPVFENHVENEVVIESPPVRPERRVTTSQQKELPKQYRVVIVGGLAVFIYTLLIVLDTSSIHIGTIFLPLFLFEVSELFSSQHKSERSFIFLLLMANAKNSHLATVIRQLELISRILQDTMIYFFIFVCCDFFKHVIISR